MERCENQESPLESRASIEKRAVINKLFIDVGGTKTRLELISSAGQRIRTKTIPSNANLHAHIKNFIHSLPKPQVHLMVGLRGVWTWAEKNTARNQFKKYAQKISVMSDIELAYLRAFGEDPGIILNAGTGSIALGRSKTGKVARSGGLGPILGDEGSGFWIGREYLKLLKYHHLNNRSKTIFNISRWAKKAIRTAYRTRSAPLMDLIGRAHFHLLRLVMEVKLQLHMRGPVLVKLHGGLFKNRRFRKEFEEKLGGLKMGVLHGARRAGGSR